MEFCSFIVKPNSLNSRQRDIQILSEVVVFKLLHFEKPIHEKWKFYKFLVHSIKKFICDSRITNP